MVNVHSNGLKTGEVYKQDEDDIKVGINQE